MALTERTKHQYHIFRSVTFNKGAASDEQDDISSIRSLETLSMRLIHSCASGDVDMVKKIADFGSKKFIKEGEDAAAAKRRILEAGDYDKRTCLHLAAAEGHLEIVKYLIENKVSHIQDRWGVTPEHEVRKHLQVKFVINYFMRIN